MNDAVPFTDSRFAGLHRMVLDAPADDGPRLVLADYYEEVLGDADRAEFIQVQIELAANPPCKEKDHQPQGDYPGCGNWFHSPLRARESALLVSHGMTWAEPLARLLPKCERCDGRGYPVIPVNPTDYRLIGEVCIACRGSKRQGSWRFSRGFVSHLSCPLAALWRPCERCYGSGTLQVAGGVDMDCDGIECDSCYGSGSLGIGDAVWACVPVTSVELDREPRGGTFAGAYGWWDVRQGAAETHDRDEIPGEIWDRIACDDHRPNDGYKWFPNAALADSALSTAVVRHFRRRAGLLELEVKT